MSEVTTLFRVQTAATKFSSVISVGENVRLTGCRCLATYIVITSKKKKKERKSDEKLDIEKL